MSILDWLARGRLAVFDWLQHILAKISGPRGGGGTIPDDKCCHLARTDNECNWVGSKSQFTCPEGLYRQWWYCCEGTQQIACGECTESPNTCWSGPFECSIWWETGQKC